MSRTAASLLREALEHVGVRYTFGIPGVQNTEIYDELAASASITPVLVGHEGLARPVNWDHPPQIREEADFRLVLV